MIGPLSGYTIGVTADRRSDEQISLLTGRGAECIHGPTVRTHPLRPEAEISDATQKLLAEPPDFVVATTGIGMRGWLEAADALLMGEELRCTLSRSCVLARGPKAHGAAVTAGIDVEWNAPGATSADVVDWLASNTEPGDRVAVQVDGAPDQQVVKDLIALGLDVVPVPVYRWTLPENLAPAETLVRAVVDGRVDGLTFTARPAAENFVHLVRKLGLFDEVQRMVGSSVTVFCVGPVCAEGVADLCIEEPVQPDRFRLGAMIMSVTTAMEKRNLLVSIGGQQVALQGRMVAVEGEPAVMLTGREHQVLAALMDPPGPVVSKTGLLKTVWGSSETDAHVVEVTVARLRRKLGPAGIGIETVVRRGYRVSAD